MGYAYVVQAVNFLPAITGSIIGGTATYSVRVGFYSRTGNQVLIQGSLVWTGHTGTGDMLITGTPFPCRSLENYKAIGSLAIANISVPANTITCVTQITSGSSIITPLVMRHADGIAPIDMDANGQLHFNISYLV